MRFHTMGAAGLAGVVLLLGVCAARADQITASSYAYKGGVPSFVTMGKVFSVWNANDPKQMLAPGLKVTFFGEPRDCGENAFNGPVAAKGNPRLAGAQQLTGLALEPNAMVWSPSGNTDQCDPDVRGLVGDSFVFLNGDPAHGGFGIFTYTGRDTGGREPFFRQYGTSGRKNTGANANINGTFVNLRFDWKGDQQIAPWVQAQAGTDPVVEFRTLQSVGNAVVSTKSGRNAGDKPVQAKQQMVLALINRDCFEKSGGRDKLCQLKYLFNVAVFRSGVTNLHAERWFRDAGIFFDIAQGGIPIVHGPLQAPGTVVSDKRTKLPLYVSVGEPSQERPFSDKTFAVRISFAQLMNAMRTIAAGKSQRSPESIAPAEIAQLFGERWNDAREWLVLSVNVSQEVSNPERNERAFIGGSFREIYAGPR